MKLIKLYIHHSTQPTKSPIPFHTLYMTFFFKFIFFSQICIMFFILSIVTFIILVCLCCCACEYHMKCETPGLKLTEPGRLEVATRDVNKDLRVNQFDF